MRLRRALDLLYELCGKMAACCLLLLLVVVIAQVLARWTGNIFAGGTNYAGYLMATATFLALAHTLNHGAHIRVSLLLNRLGRYRRLGEGWCLAVSTIFACFLSGYAVKFVIVSYQLKEISQGLDKTPVWIPQVPMVFGAVVLSIALLDKTWQVIVQGRLPTDGKFGQMANVTAKQRDG